MFDKTTNSAEFHVPNIIHERHNEVYYAVTSILNELFYPDIDQDPQASQASTPATTSMPAETNTTQPTASVRMTQESPNHKLSENDTVSINTTKQNHNQSPSDTNQMSVEALLQRVEDIHNEPLA